ncbi:hypothetical protein [Mucilaginibacter ginsenosidivorans]|uniref:Bacteriocin n=1 Tax=Mucilaginibacter ginsenosidivorans TaxID=398053 RepID=A0A5B8UVN9_9SPHI|nr:hypothetical protein [Mucilaginibacter ginsenosidivorans]QEC63134.1 hypothetical protein FRZ54_11285 [Mucilaginibacter ginsenosidivorans]
MKNKVKLSRDEMKIVKGGTPPTCTVTCYFPGGGITTVTVGNYPYGSGCNDPYLHCPDGATSATCACP